MSITMRELIDLIEAKAKTIPGETISVHELKSKTLIVATEYVRDGILRNDEWNNEWVDQLKTRLTDHKNSHEQMEREEAESRETHVITPYDVKEGLPYEIKDWWEKTKIYLTYDHDLRYEEDEYFEYHEDVDASDEISLLQAEKDLCSAFTISGLDTPAHMLDVVKKIPSTNLISQLHGVTIKTSTRGMITKTIPLILFYCAVMK